MLKCNWIDFFNEEEKVELLKDEKEKKIRLHLLDEIKNQIYEYDAHISDYEYLQKRSKVIDRGVIFNELPSAKGIKALWSRIFASDISRAIKKEIRFNSFKWHIFSFNKVKALTKTKARNAFDKCQKSKVYIFYQHDDRAFSVENPHLLSSKDFDMDYDIYIFDPIEKWTYVYTHEITQCGPYFYKIKNK